jgi:hypothetical protein
MPENEERHSTESSLALSWASLFMFGRSSYIAALEDIIRIKNLYPNNFEFTFHTIFGYFHWIVLPKSLTTWSQVCVDVSRFDGNVIGFMTDRRSTDSQHLLQGRRKLGSNGDNCPSRFWRNVSRTKQNMFIR